MIDEIQLAIVANALTLLALVGAVIGWTIRELRLAKERKEDQLRRTEIEQKEAQRAKEKSLRKDEVLIWAKDAVRAMQSVVVLCADWGPKFAESDRVDELRRLAIDLSVLLEQGRLFFKNESTSWGHEKEKAYQGFRPRILDHLLVGYCVASRWESLGADQNYAAKVVENAAKAFISLAQSEVGREDAASVYNREGGENVDLEELIGSEKSNSTI